MKSLKYSLLAMLIALSGCVTVGEEFPVNKLETIQKGQTKTEVAKIFGQPWRVGKDMGYRTWTYVHYKISLFGEQKTRDLVIRFDTADKVVSFTFNSTYREDEHL
ncbi:MAG: outer membrane protein assembly factor BamE [Gammaproteobacteria bacterium]|nr:outer membrane protein assembly factor BamE [Gammaproteobacteria bacterium]